MSHTSFGGSPSNATPSMTDSRVSIVTFGCRVNQYETAMMERLLEPRQPVVSDDADVYVLNACTVTSLAERKARQAARRLRREHPDSTIVVIGCLADAVEKGLTRFGGADLLAGNAWKTRIVEVVERARAGARGLLPPIEFRPIGEEVSAGRRERIRAHLKIQDGCSHACAYCRATQVRGGPRSKPIDDAVAEAIALVRSGFPEIVLTGTDLAQYAPSGGTLADIVRRVLAIDGLLRLRIASIDPAGLSAPLIEAFGADRRACPHFHVPLQSGDDRILQRMARGYTISDYLGRIDAVRKGIPHATFGTDIIVGFPGEDEAAFANTRRVVAAVGFTNLHAFRYSPRPGTAAVDLSDAVPEDVKRRRADSLVRQWRRGLHSQLDNRIASTQHVLVEERRGDEWRGHTSDYLYVHFASNEEIPIGSIRPVRIVGVVEEHLEGTVDG
jgi:threonylcarbamoyladenosine tRNA methylthiotransferase MtaB